MTHGPWLYNTMEKIFLTSSSIPIKQWIPNKLVSWCLRNCCHYIEAHTKKIRENANKLLCLKPLNRDFFRKRMDEPIERFKNSITYWQDWLQDPWGQSPIAPDAVTEGTKLVMVFAKHWWGNFWVSRRYGQCMPQLWTILLGKTYKNGI